ncbi:synergin gamma [Plectropomus leopardus]|uniref:synergin gamma n=2 Tax=Plectropomus leopardus TaxID=160734 RepID=UPI001C4A7E38|nr:synergin gamma [Plectropomus leopardus]
MYCSSVMVDEGGLTDSEWLRTPEVNMRSELTPGEQRRGPQRQKVEAAGANINLSKEKYIHMYGAALTGVFHHESSSRRPLLCSAQSWRSVSNNQHPSPYIVTTATYSDSQAGHEKSFIYPVGGGLGPPQGMVPMQQQQQQQQQGFPMVPVMQPNMQGMMGMNFGGQMAPGAMPIQGGMAIGMQTPGMQFLGQPQFMGMRPAGPQYTADMQKQMAEEHQKRIEQQQKMLEEERKRRQFEEQKQKLRLLSSVKPKTGEKSRDDALEAIKGNLDGFSRDAKMHPTPSSQTKKPDSSPPHPSVTTHSLPPALSEDSDEFSDFQGPVDAPVSLPPPSSTSSTFGLSSQALVQPSSSAPKTGFSQDDDEFSDFVQGPLNAFPPSNFNLSSQAQVQPSSPSLRAGLSSSSSSSLPQSLPASVSIPTVTQHSAVNTSTQSTFQGPSLEEKLFSSCDLTADKTAQVNFKSKQSLVEMGPRTKVSAQFHSSTKARNWAVAPEDLSSVFIAEKLPEALVSAPSIPPSAADSTPHTSSDSGVGVYPQQEHIQPMLPAWIYNDSLVPEMFKKVLEFTMTPAGIDTAKLYPILMSSGLPREALGQIWASANRTTPGMLTKEELYTVLALIGVAQSGLPAMNVEILSQFPSPPVPNLPALAMAMAPVMPQHQQPMMTKPPVSMPMPTPAPPVMTMTPPAPTQAPTNTNFIATFPPAQAQGTKGDDDDFQDFQEAPKAGAVDQAFTEFQGESGGSFSTTITPQNQNSAPAMLTPVSGSSSVAVTSSDKYAVFKQLSVDQPAEPTPPASDIGDKYSVFRQLEQPADKKPVEGFADFKSVSADDGFTDFKTADSVSPLDPSDQAKIFQPTFPSTFPTSQSLQQLPQQQQQPAVSLSQPKNPLNMADLDLFSSIAPSVPAPTETKPSTFPSVSVPPSLVLLPGGAKPPGGSADDFGDFALFGSSSDAAQASAAGGAVAAPQDDFADFMAFGSSGGEPKGESSSVGVQGETSTQQRPQQSSDKYDVFKQLSLEGGLAYDDTKESGGGSFSSLKSDTDDFADFQSSKFCTALGASEKTLVDKVAAFKQAKEDSASVKSLDLPSIGGSSVGKDDSEDALSVQLDMKLSDMGGDLKHVMSDSSLDLPGLSAHQPPATEGDDMKFDPFGTSALSTLASYDWSDREECLPGEVRKSQGFEGASLPSLAPAQRKELTFGSTENITGSSVAKISTTFPTEDGSSTDNKFEAFADFGSGEQGGVDDEDDFGDFASTVSEKSDSPPATAEPGSEGNQSEPSDEFGAFQGDKPKFGKSDFLKASAQTKVKSSEEMIKNELATFDLSVQGSHKRSHSLGDKEIGRSPPSPAPEQPFRDRSNTLSEKPALPVIRDKYKDLTGEVEESERYAYEWQRCLESALEVITKANNILNGISSSSVCTEVIQSAQGMEYLLGVVEVYRVTRRVELGIKATAVCSEKLQQLLKDISRVWNNLMGFMSLAKLAPDESSLDFSSCILRHGIKNAKELACGVCLLNVDARSKNKEESTIGRLFKRV